MRNLTIGSIAALAILFAAGTASADSIEISFECSWYVGVECELECSELDFEAYCDFECESFEISAECSASCSVDCEAECEANGGSIDCEAYCEGECGANCSGECEASDNSAACQGECSAYCEGNCGASCEGTPPSIDCEGGCDASCEGECTAEANIDCHFCTVDASIDCDASCDVDGMLECNGEYIGDFSFEDALNWVKENTNFDITYEGEADCSGNECHAKGSCAIECAVGSAPGSHSSIPALVIGLVALIPLIRRRFR